MFSNAGPGLRRVYSAQLSWAETILPSGKLEERDLWMRAMPREEIGWFTL